MTECPFCDPQRWVQNLNTVALVADAYPVAKGHTLIVPKRHVESILDLAQDEWFDVRCGLEAARRILAAKHDADGFTIGANAGQAAGQTIAHAHMHVIPRHAGDTPDPTGGIRQVLAGY